jgi:biopolymer transport protein ExbD
MMFLLLIFFIMTTTLSRVTGIVSDMPAGSAAAQQAAEKTPTIALHDNKITMDDKDMSREEMERTLRAMKLDQRTGNAKVVILQTAGQVSYQDYYQTMAFIQNCGGVVAIETEEGEGSK